MSISITRRMRVWRWGGLNFGWDVSLSVYSICFPLLSLSSICLSVCQSPFWWSSRLSVYLSIWLCIHPPSVCLLSHLSMSALSLSWTISSVTYPHWCLTCISLVLACPVGYYGDGCQGQCLCKFGGICDHVTGNCSCPLGKTGRLCEYGETHWGLTV